MKFRATFIDGSWVETYTSNETLLLNLQYVVDAIGKELTLVTLSE